jgi:hypothetical protein
MMLQGENVVAGAYDGGLYSFQSGIQSAKSWSAALRRSGDFTHAVAKLGPCS